MRQWEIWAHLEECDAQRLHHIMRVCQERIKELEEEQ
jgi:hypothetical protein